MPLPRCGERASRCLARRCPRWTKASCSAFGRSAIVSGHALFARLLTGRVLSITVFRDGCKGDQVLNVGIGKKDKAPAQADA